MITASTTSYSKTKPDDKDGDAVKRDKIRVVPSSLKQNPRKVNPLTYEYDIQLDSLGLT